MRKNTSYSYNSKSGNYSNKTTYSIIDDSGNQHSYSFIDSGHIETPEERKKRKIQKFSFVSSLIGKLLLVSIILFFGGYFFSGGFNSSIVATQKEEVIINEINGVEYQYNVKYVDYDYTTKLNQLSNLRNVFDLTPIGSVATTSLIVPDDPLKLTPNLYYQWVVGNLRIVDYSFYDLETQEERVVQFLNYNLGFKIVMSVDSQLASDFQKYVNVNNVSDYVSLTYVVESKEIQDSVLSIILRVLKYMNAPIIWVGNFIYDLGVILEFVVNW